MNQAQQDLDGRRYDALVRGDMWRTTGKKTPTGRALVATVDGDEIRRLQQIAEACTSGFAGNASRALGEQRGVMREVFDAMRATQASAASVPGARQ